MLILQKDKIEALVEMNPLFPKLEKAFQDYSEGRVKCRPSEAQITLADTTGIAVHDIAMAVEVLERSRG